EYGGANGRRQRFDRLPEPRDGESAFYEGATNGSRGAAELPQQDQRDRGKPGRDATQVERTANQEGGRPEIYSFAGAAERSREFPAKGKSREKGFEKSPQTVAPGHRLAGKPAEMAQHRRDALRGGAGRAVGGLV